MTEKTVPRMGSKGIFAFSQPVDVVVIPNIIYECISLRSVNDYINNGEDLYSIAYDPYGINTTDYNIDVKNREIIVGLQNDAGEIIYVPNNYIASYPISDGVPYHGLGLSVYIGLIPKTQVLTSLKEDIIDSVYNRIGLTASVTEVELSEIIMISSEDDAAFQLERHNNSTIHKSNKALIDELRITVTRYQTIISRLKAKLIELTTP